MIAHRRQWGWRFVDEFCWRKTDNGVPGGWGNRFKNAWEPVFHFCRQPEIKFRPQAVGHVSEDCFDYSPEQPEVDFRQRACSAPGRAERRRAGSEPEAADEDGRFTGIARPSNVVEVKSESRPGIALGSVPACAGRVFPEGVLRCRRYRLRSVHGQSAPRWLRLTCSGGPATAAKSVRRTAM